MLQDSASIRSMSSGLRQGLRSDTGLIDFALREQIDHAVQTDVVDGVSSLPTDNGLGIVSDADSCLCHHFEVVGTVAESDNLLFLQFELLADFLHFNCLCVGVDDFLRQFAAQFAVDDFQRVGIGVVKFQAIFQPLGEKSEATGYQ